jgi:hypothetical protein
LPKPRRGITNCSRGHAESAFAPLCSRSHTTRCWQAPASLLFSFFWVEGAYTQQGRANIRRLHPAEAARPARSFSPPGKVLHSCCSLSFVVVEGVYIQQRKAQEDPPQGIPPEGRGRGGGRRRRRGGGGANNRSNPNRLRRSSRRSRRSRPRNLGRTGRRSKAWRARGRGVVAVVEQLVTDEGESGEGRGVAWCRPKFSLYCVVLGICENARDGHRPASNFFRA